MEYSLVPGSLQYILHILSTYSLQQSFSSVHFSSIQLLNHVRLLATPWITAHQASPSITNSRSLLKLMSIELVMPSSHLILCRAFSSCPQSLPASGSFPMSQCFAWGGQSIGVSASASVRPMNTQDWSFRMEWLDLHAIFRDHLIQLFTDEKMERNIPSSDMKFPYLCTYLSIFSHLVELHLCIQFHSFQKELLSLMCPCISHSWSSSYPSKSAFPPP